MNKVLVGERTVLYSDTFILHGEERCRIEVSLPLGGQVVKETLKLELHFESPADADTRVIWASADGVVTFTLRGWRNPLGEVTVNPVHFGQTDGQKLWLDIAHYQIGVINVAHVVLLLGGQANGT